MLEAGSGGQRPEYRVNTNLEQISDWLTKILVGVGLVQLGSIIDSVGRLADFVGSALGDGPAGPAFAWPCSCASSSRGSCSRTCGPA